MTLRNRSGMFSKKPIQKTDKEKLLVKSSNKVKYQEKIAIITGAISCKAHTPMT